MSRGKILAYEANWRKRKIKEGIFIAKTSYSVLLNIKLGMPVNSIPIPYTLGTCVIYVAYSKARFVPHDLH